MVERATSIPITAMPDRFERACSMLLEAACESAESGATREYFERWSKGEKGEAHRRQQFFKLRRQLETNGTTPREEAIELFKRLNSEYGTRYNLSHLEQAGAAILAAIPDLPWSSNLFDLSEDQAVTVATSVPAIMQKIRAAVRKRPYSLTTKYLHFLFPDLFVIYDSQAAQSVWMWSLFAIGEDQPDAQSFLVSGLQNTDGSGYSGMVRFYYRVWHCCRPDLRERTRGAVNSLEGALRNMPGTGDARVTVLDLIDKHLWKCNGNPIRLGLARHWSK